MKIPLVCTAPPPSFYTHLHNCTAGWPVGTKVGLVHMLAEDIATADKMIELFQNGNAFMELADSFTAAGIGNVTFARTSPTGFMVRGLRRHHQDHHGPG